MLTFFFGVFVGAVVTWLCWESRDYAWTATHGLRADLFGMSREEVAEELAFVARHRERMNSRATNGVAATAKTVDEQRNEGANDGRK